MAEPIPTTEEMREAHRWLARDPSREDLWPQDDAYSDWDFDRWLAEHDREVYQRGVEDCKRSYHAGTEPFFNA